MPEFGFWVNSWDKRYITFEAESLEDAKRLIQETSDVDELPEVSDTWKSGGDEFDYGSLEEIKPVIIQQVLPLADDSFTVSVEAQEWEEKSE